MRKVRRAHRSAIIARLNILTKIIRVLWIPRYRAAFLRTRVAASTEHDAILADLSLATVVDIGANRGQFALCIRRLFPAAQIYSFEPLSRPARTWREVFKGDAKAELFEAAVGDRAGTADMHVSRWDVSSSLLPIGQAQHDNFPLTEEARRESVTTVLLTDRISATHLRGRSLLKLDVQGFELSALRGCGELLARFDFVYVEASFVELYVGQALASEVLAYLLAQGFRLVCVANLSHGKSVKPIQADFLFARA
jgi:FkbM family methyltransferase